MKKNLHVYVTIGSSAGGLEALSELVASLDKKTGFYYFLAQHHSRTEKSILAGLLNKIGHIKVVALQKDTVFEPDIIYVIPPELILVTENDRLIVKENNTDTRVPLPNIDFLLNEICKIKNSKIIAIVLSGSGTDATEGMKSVKKRDGITIAQSPEDAIFESMPSSAINEKVVDYILPVKDIGEKLFDISTSFQNGTYFAQEIPFDSIRKILYREKQLDLFKYKDETVTRRIAKRMQILKIDTLKKYENYLKSHHDEIESLNNEILIGITEFFRGKEAFDALKIELTKKLREKKELSEFRVWSVACSSGEEAYSIAILINEICEDLGKKLHVKIFATDIDETALQKARNGVYSKSALENLDNSWIEKYFQKIEEGYRIKKRFREQIIFAYHNILLNPPFINLDMITCRNILIYLIHSAQRELLSLFHFTLNKGGLLFLGYSESVQNGINLFTALNSKYKVYEKKEDDETRLHRFSSQPINRHTKTSTSSKEYNMKTINPQTIEKHLKEKVFDYFSDGCLIIDREYNIIYKKGDIPYLNFSDGVFSPNLFTSLDKDLHYNVGILLKHVTVSNKPEMTKFIQLESSENERFVRITAQPFYVESHKSMILLSFEELEPKNMQLNATFLPKFSENSVISTLSSQLTEARDEIKNVSYELTFSKQNMAMVNEELQESNEKLQSTVEELETSNEELQSSNEELQVSLSANKELQNRLSLILDSSIDGILGLDMQACHTFVNTKAAQLLGYSQEYLIGKDSHKLWHHTKPDGSSYPEEECPITKVLLYGEEARGEDLFWRSDGSSFPVEFVRSPIREGEKITGAVVIFHDITKRKELEAQTIHEQELMNTYLDVSGLIILILDKDANIVAINKAGCKLLGISKEKAIGLNWFDNFIDKENTKETKKIFHSMINDTIAQISHHVNNIVDINKQAHIISWNNATYRNEDGEAIGVIATGNDITKEKYLALELKKVNVKYEQTFKTAQIGIVHKSLDGSFLDVNEYMCKLIGYTKEELLCLNAREITHPDDREKETRYIQQLLDKKRESFHIEKRYIHKNGNTIWISLSAILIRDSDDQPLYFISIIQDISQIKMLMLELEAKKNELESIIRFAPNPIMLYAEDGTVLMINDAWEEITGYTIKDIPTIERWNEKSSINKKPVKQLDTDKLFKNKTRFDMGEVTVETKNGRQLTWLLSFSPLNDLYNDQRVVISSAMDVTEIHKNEELMLAQSRQAAMGDMIGMIAHQWRQPLSVIGMVANNLKASIQLNQNVSPDEIEKLTDVLNEQTQYLSHTIDDFRTFFKPEKAKEMISLCKIYEKLRNMIQKTIENNDITLNFINKCETEFYTYPNELIQVLLNLINNAKDAIKERKVKDPTIEIHTSYTKDKLTITVSDNAGGIDASVINNLGEPYVSTKKQNGTGLGIYMSLIILNKHFNGTLKWENRNGGSSFIIELPLNIAEDKMQ
ncbi:PAS domain S-box protein [bacterium]|nr:PAS domain S-box protein [bacterium]MBU1884344.1 PAS domain S-box protein [bacterium]